MASLHLTRNSDSVTVSIREERDLDFVQLRTVDHYQLVIGDQEITEDDIEEYRR
jgi:hypothetical protein